MSEFSKFGCGVTRLRVCMKATYLCRVKILSRCISIGRPQLVSTKERGRGSNHGDSHLLGETSDITGNILDFHAAVVMLIELVAEAFKHGGVGITRQINLDLLIAAVVALDAAVGDLRRLGSGGLDIGHDGEVGCG